MKSVLKLIWSFFGKFDIVIYLNVNEKREI